MADIIESIQQIEFTIASGATTGTSTITSVTTANSAVFFSYGLFGGQRQTATTIGSDHVQVRVDLTNSTTVTATRDTSNTFAITIICTVVEFKAAAIDSIQQGTVTVSGTNASGTDTITSVTTSRSVVLFNGSSTPATAVSGEDSLFSLSLTNSTTVTATRNSTDNNGDHVIAYTVIEFDATAVNSVQEVAIAVTSGTSNTATISSVDTSSSIIFPAGFQHFGNLTVDHSPYLELTNSTTVTATIDTANASGVDIVGTVVEFNNADIDSVQRGVATMATSDTTKDVTITSVDTSSSMVNALGATSTASFSFDPEEQSFTIEILNATTIRATKNVTGRDVTFSWEVIEFSTGVSGTDTYIGAIGIVGYF